jgi:hypothetical protein
MRDVDKNTFSGKGSTPGDAYTQSFNLPMTCNAGTKVSVKMEGVFLMPTEGHQYYQWQ